MYNALCLNYLSVLDFAASNFLRFNFRSNISNFRCISNLCRSSGLGMSVLFGIISIQYLFNGYSTYLLPVIMAI